jgi:hypothetical protein
MSKKANVPMRIAPLQRVILEPITDPAGIAAIDKLRKEARRKLSGQKARMTGKGGKMEVRAGGRKEDD